MARIHTPLWQRGVVFWPTAAHRVGRVCLCALTLALGSKLLAQGADASLDGAVPSQETQRIVAGEPIAGQTDSNVVNVSEIKTAVGGLNSSELPATRATPTVEMNAASPANQIPSVRTLIWFNAGALAALSGLLLGRRKAKVK